MIRSIAMLVIGAVLGGGAAFLLRDPANLTVDAWPLRIADGDAESVEAALARAKARPSSTRRDLEIEELVARLAAESASGAVDTARAQGLDARFVATAYRYWADDDPNAALNALGELASAAERRAVALTLLDVLGFDAASGERIAAALPSAERASFHIGRLERLAERDPDAALYELMSFTGPGQLTAAERIGTASVAVDPLRALVQAAALPADVQSRFRNALYAEWARLDPGAVLAHIETNAPSLLDTIGALQHIALGDPETLLAAADRLPRDHASAIRVLALTELIERNPDAAIARLEAMPPEPGREPLIMMVAIAYARHDPEAALALIDELAPGSPNAKMAVAAGLAQTDPVRAIDMLNDGVGGPEGRLMQGAVLQLVTQDSAQAARVATTLADRGRASDAAMLANLMSNWVQQSPEPALEWLATRTDLQPFTISTAAVNLANRDAAMAARYLARIPAAYRYEWIVRIAGPYARSDLEAALTWIGQFEGQEVFDDAYSQLVSHVASADSSAARELLDRYVLDADTKRRLEEQIAAREVAAQ